MNTEIVVHPNECSFHKIHIQRIDRKLDEASLLSNNHNQHIVRNELARILADLQDLRAEECILLFDVC